MIDIDRLDRQIYFKVKDQELTDDEILAKYVSYTVNPQEAGKGNLYEVVFERASDAAFESFELIVCYNYGTPAETHLQGLCDEDNLHSVVNAVVPTELEEDQPADDSADTDLVLGIEGDESDKDELIKEITNELVREAPISIENIAPVYK